MRLLDSSVVLASLHEAEPHHEACNALLLQGGHALYVHALAECFPRSPAAGKACASTPSLRTGCCAKACCLT
jgi:hypothetical protein